MAFDLDDEELEMTRTVINHLPPKRKIKVGNYIRTKFGTFDRVKDIGVFFAGFDILGETGIWSSKEITNFDDDFLNIVKVNDIVNGSRVRKIHCSLNYDDYSEPGNKEVNNGILLEDGTYIYFVEDIKDVITHEIYKDKSYKISNLSRDTKNEM